MLKQLKRSRRAGYDYNKGNEGVPCYGFVASKTEDIVALTFFVSFEKRADGTVRTWIQDFEL